MTTTTNTSTVPAGSGTCRNPLHCYIPPHVLDALLRSRNEAARRAAIENLRYSEAIREVRETMGMMSAMAATRSPDGQKHRLVYDLGNRRRPLPGQLARSEGADPTDDPAVNEAYCFSGVTYDFYKEVLNRNSIDGRGMQIVSSVHYGHAVNNAFWTGQQMVYGDGDGHTFVRFTKALDVVAHELTHGVVQHTSNLVYENESGALNEHFSDVMGEVVQQWYRGDLVTDASWYMGGCVIAPSLEVQGLRTFTAEKAYKNHPTLGSDPQPKHMEDKYIGTADYGGVHINSGIPNHAFYLAATALGGSSWERAAPIWYRGLQQLNRDSQFQDAAEATFDVATRLYGQSEAEIVRTAWNRVGIAL